MYISGSSSGNYITGMVSGMDVDTMVKNLMDAERVSYDSKYQEIQYYEWKLEAYQEQTSALNAFQSSYFDYTNPETNLLSESTFMSYTCESSDSSISAEVLDSDKVEDQYTIDVLQKATTANIEGQTDISSSICGSRAVDYTSLEGQVLSVELDGVEKDITISDLDASGDISIEDIQLSLDDAFGSGKLLASDGSGNFDLDTVTDSGSHEVSISGDEALTSLGFESTDVLSNRITTTKSLEDISNAMQTPFSFDEDGMITMTINNVLFEFESSTSLDNMIDTISDDSDADVTMTYDVLNDAFKIEADETGAGSTLVISEEGSDFLSSTGLTTINDGQDVIVTVNGEKIVRSDNNIEVDGISFSITDITTSTVTIDINLETDAIYDTVVDFVTSYNALIESIQGDVDEEKDYDYYPLTDAQKEEMSDDEVESWEAQVKVGILANDSLLEDMLTEMRQALYTPIEGLELTLADLGIKTDTYESGGILTIDESVLMEMIDESPQDVVELFTKQSEDYPGTSNRTLDSVELETRYNEEGLMFRLYDITETYISSTSDNNGNKGLLIEKCGFSDDFSEISSTMYERLSDLEDKLLDMEDDLTEKEEQYYSKFSVMETYMSDMNSQLQMVQSWFT
jgi:flagellar hook-associated protein 2